VETNDVPFDEGAVIKNDGKGVFTTPFFSVNFGLKKETGGYFSLPLSISQTTLYRLSLRNPR
jgi:hypothetical protein